MEQIKNIVEKSKDNIPRFAEHPNYNKRQEYLNEFSIEDNTMLHAYYVIKAVKRLEELRPNADSTINEIKHEFYWAFTWQKTIENKNIKQVEQHLRDVCTYHLNKYFEPYSQGWLLDFDKVLLERLIKKYFPHFARSVEVKNIDIDDL